VIRALVADDQEVVRAGFSALLDTQPDVAVVASAANGSEAVQLSNEHSPDVVLMDVRMPVLDGIEATRQICERDSDRPRILILTTFDLDEYVYDALQAGASGFLLKDATREQLAAAVRTVADGGSLLAPAITRRLIEDYCRRPEPGRSPEAAAALSERELDVLRRVARGRSNAEIAAELVLSEATVKSHVARILDKLGLRDRTQVIVFAYESGLVQPGAPT
jgi:DNA-binding NarL/FixJ family response regulator